MKKNLNHIVNTTFIRELIESEFFYIKTNTRKLGLYSVDSRLNFNKSNQFQILDLFDLNTSLKQLIRFLFSFNYSKHALQSESIIYIWCSNPFLLEFINIFISDYNLQTKITVLSDFPIIDYTAVSYAEKIRRKQKQKLLFVLGDPWLKNPKSLIDNFIIKNGISFVQVLNFKREKQDFGFYKIQNDISDYKKVVILLIIIESIINQTVVYSE